MPEQTIRSLGKNTETSEAVWTSRRYEVGARLPNRPGNPSETGDVTIMAVMSLTAYEVARLATMPVMPALYGDVRSLLKRFVPSGASILDVGGRKSWYTVGLPALVTVSDLPREDQVQHDLNLGVTENIADGLRTRRSNIVNFIYDDMSATCLPPGSFDAIVSVEVIEHVDEDVAFVANLEQTLRPGGVAILTTPNGDRDPDPSGDHRRHYRREQLTALLSARFQRVQVSYGVTATTARKRGLASFDSSHPARTFRAATGNIVSRYESGRPSASFDAFGSAHLIAVAWKAEGPGQPG